MADHNKEVNFFIAQLKKKKLFLTFERRVILDCILQTKKHFSVDEIMDALEGAGRRVSRSSVYKTLGLLDEFGMVKNIRHADRSIHYEYVNGGRVHGHLMCEKCGAIIEFQDKGLRALEKRVSLKHDFSSHKLTLKILGLCSECGKK
jgi:Fur family ferric uptake transcriptional regulator